jgi:hypothetical protein
VAVSENSGQPGSPVTISGTGFGPNESVEVKYRTGRKDSGPVAVVITTATTAEDGSFTCSGQIPSAATAGAKGFHPLVAKGSAYGVRAATAFTLI